MSFLRPPSQAFSFTVKFVFFLSLHCTLTLLLSCKLKLHVLPLLWGIVLYLIFLCSYFQPAVNSLSGLPHYHISASSSLCTPVSNFIPDSLNVSFYTTLSLFVLSSLCSPSSCEKPISSPSGNLEAPYRHCLTSDI